MDTLGTQARTTPATRPSAEREQKKGENRHHAATRMRS